MLLMFVIYGVFVFANFLLFRLMTMHLDQEESLCGIIFSLLAVPITIGLLLHLLVADWGIGVLLAIAYLAS